MKAKEVLLFMATKEDLLTACNLRRNNKIMFARSLNHDKSDLPLHIALCEDIFANDLIQAVNNKSL